MTEENRNYYNYLLRETPRVKSLLTYLETHMKEEWIMPCFDNLEEATRIDILKMGIKEKYNEMIRHLIIYGKEAEMSTRKGDEYND